MNFSVYSGGKKVTDKLTLRQISKEDIAVFESLRTYNGKVFRREEHLDRLIESARTAVGSLLVTRQRLRAEIDGALKAFLAESRSSVKKDASGDIFFRINVWEREVFIMIGRRAHPPALYERGVALKTSAVRRSLSHAAPPEAKTFAYQNSLLAALEPSHDHVYESVLLDRDGRVTEVTIGNLFIVKHGGLFTPPLAGILNGVTRRFVVECAHRAGITVEEVPLMRHEIYNADEAFLTNTSWEILPVAELDGRRIGSAVPGSITQKLHRLFRQQARKECR